MHYTCNYNIFCNKYPLSVQNIKHGSKLYVNTDIAEIQQFRNRYNGCIIFFICCCTVIIKLKFYDAEECSLDVRMPFYVGGVSDEGSVCQ